MAVLSWWVAGGSEAAHLNEVDDTVGEGGQGPATHFHLGAHMHMLEAHLNGGQQHPSPALNADWKSQNSRRSHMAICTHSTQTVKLAEQEAA